MQATLFLKLAVTLVIVMVLAASLAVHLNVVRFQETYTALVEQRLAVVLEDARRDVLVGLDLGLTLAGMEALPQTLERALAIMPDTQAIRVLDCDGVPVAMAGLQTAGDTPWLDHLHEPRWTSFSPNILAAGEILIDNLGDCAGTLVVEMAVDTHRAAQARLAERLWQGAALTLLLLIPALAFVALLLHRRHALIAHMSADLDAIAAGIDDPDGARHPEVDPRRALTDSEARMVVAYREARRALARDAGGRP